jgi:hypothetical protein
MPRTPLSGNELAMAQSYQARRSALRDKQMELAIQLANQEQENNTRAMKEAHGSNAMATAAANRTIALLADDDMKDYGELLDLGHLSQPLFAIEE